MIALSIWLAAACAAFAQGDVATHQGDGGVLRITNNQAGTNAFAVES